MKKKRLLTFSVEALVLDLDAAVALFSCFACLEGKKTTANF
jgi:hypothetical protein